MTDITEAITQLRALILETESVRSRLLAVADTIYRLQEDAEDARLKGYAQGIGEMKDELALFTDKVIPKILQDASYACECCDSKHDCHSPASCPSSGYSKWSWGSVDINQ